MRKTADELRAIGQTLCFSSTKTPENVALGLTLVKARWALLGALVDMDQVRPRWGT